VFITSLTFRAQFELSCEFCLQEEPLPPPPPATPRPEEPTAESVGLPTVLETPSIDEIIKTRKILPLIQDNEEQDTMIGPEHVVLTGHIDIADQGLFEGSTDDADRSDRTPTLFEYRNLRSIRVRRAALCAVHHKMTQSFWQRPLFLSTLNNAFAFFWILK
jgi:hypothetical protein